MWKYIHCIVDSLSETVTFESDSNMKIKEKLNGENVDHEVGDCTCDEVIADNDISNDSLYFLPVTNNLILSHGCKPLTALGVDPAGARLATGGFDFDVKLWDFGGMDSSCRPFNVIRPCDEHQIKHIEFNQSGSFFEIL